MANGEVITVLLSVGITKRNFNKLVNCHHDSPWHAVSQ